MRERSTTDPDRAVPRRRGCSARLAAASLAAAVLSAGLTGCSSPPPRPEPEPFLEDEPRDQVSDADQREQRPISDTHPYQINDYLIYPVKWNKVEDIAPTVQQLFQARYGPGVVVIPHVATNKLLIYLPPPQERQRAGAAGVGTGLPTPATTGSRGTTTRGRGVTRTTRASIR